VQLSMQLLVLETGKLGLALYMFEHTYTQVCFEQGFQAYQVELQHVMRAHVCQCLQHSQVILPYNTLAV
jgi:hypothetical protein